MTTNCIDVIFIYKFDFRIPQSPPLYGKIRLCTGATQEKIKTIIIQTINNSGKTWELDYEDIMISIISIIPYYNNHILINDKTEEFMYPIFIDIRNTDRSQYFYEGEPVTISHY
jgi:hypothetical protein